MNIFKNVVLLLITPILLGNNLIQTGNNHLIDYNLLSSIEMEVEIKLGDFEISEKTINNDKFLSINYESLYPSTKIGSPNLPQLNQLIEIPNEADVRIEIINDESIEINLNEFKIEPVQPSISKSADINQIEFNYNKNIYSEDKYIKDKLIHIENKGTLREIRIGNIMFSPFEYNPVTNKLVIHHSVQFKIHFDIKTMHCEKFHCEKTSHCTLPTPCPFALSSPKFGAWGFRGLLEGCVLF